ncbi:MAG TPA: proprotein convertase P-domain-containing protein [Solirubrobacteraceae bacterium]|jgi:subtilisin-like proprotein convertase family protein
MRRSLLLAFFATFLLTAQAGAASHYDPQGILIPGAGTMGNANPFPSSQSFHSEAGLITDVNVTLHQISHENPDDLDISLRSPGGTTVGLMSDRCGTQDVGNRTWTFDDEDDAAMTDGGPCDVTGTFKPSNIDVDVWPNQASTPDGYQLSLFDGENPNGTWQLYVVDDANSNAGSITAGYTVTLTVGGAEIKIPGGDNSEGPASEYPATTTVSSGGIVTDVDLLFDGMTHSYPGDLEVMLEGPRGQKVRLMSDACIGSSPETVDFDWDIDDEAPASFPKDEDCDEPTYRPGVYEQVGEDVDEFPSPAPAGPYGSSLSDFDRTDPDGEWKLWMFDDEDNDSGFLIDGYDLQIRTRPEAAVDLGPDVAAGEGGVAQLVVTRDGADPTIEGTIRLRTADGSAQAGLDYTPVDQVLSFAAGETSKTVDVPIVADGLGEPGQAFTASLSDPGGDAAVGARSTATVSIPPDPVPLPPPPPPVDPQFNAGNAVSLPGARRCKKRRSRLRFRAKAPAGVTLARTELFVNGRRVANLTGAKADDVIRVKVRRRRTKVRMRITATDGRVVEVKRTYKRCKPRRRRG